MALRGSQEIRRSLRVNAHIDPTSNRECEEGVPFIACKASSDGKDVAVESVVDGVPADDRAHMQPRRLSPCNERSSFDERKGSLHRTRECGARRPDDAVVFEVPRRIED